MTSFLVRSRFKLPLAAVALRTTATALSDSEVEYNETDGEPIFVACGNPTRNTGKFQRITFGNERDQWTRFSVDSRESKFTNKEQIEKWATHYGDDLCHPAEHQAGQPRREAGQRQQQRQGEDPPHVASEDDARDRQRLVGHGPQAFSVTRYSR